jgi:hypothetical protein
VNLSQVQRDHGHDHRQSTDTLNRGQSFPQKQERVQSGEGDFHHAEYARHPYLQPAQGKGVDRKGKDGRDKYQSGHPEKGGAVRLPGLHRDRTVDLLSLRFFHMNIPVCAKSNPRKNRQSFYEWISNTDISVYCHCTVHLASEIVSDKHYWFAFPHGVRRGIPFLLYL